MKQRDERKRTTAEASKKLTGDIKTGSCIVVREESSGSLSTGWVRRCGGGVTLFQALLGNVGTGRADAKGEAQVVSATRVRVPMQHTGADPPVVVMKSL